MRADIAGVMIDNVSKQEVIDKIENLVRSGKPGYAVTPYSEMVVFALNDPEYKKVLNNAALALPDGIGILWAAKFLSLKSGNFLRAAFQVVYTGAAIIFNPKYIRSVIAVKISGNELIYDICELAQKNNFTLAMVGGKGNVARQAAYELKKIFPNLKVNLTISPQAFDDQTISKIAQSNSDILLLAYSPPKQETWIAQNFQRLNVKLAIGLGGTFDYIAGKRPMPPKFMRYIGLEWLWRLITQPWRIKRIWNAVPVFIWKIYRYKVRKLKS